MELSSREKKLISENFTYSKLEIYKIDNENIHVHSTRKHFHLPAKMPSTFIHATNSINFQLRVSWAAQ